jgi:hypothetical protein
MFRRKVGIRDLTLKVALAGLAQKTVKVKMNASGNTKITVEL